MGRPSGYSDELAASICEQIAEGSSLRSICRGDEAMPSTSMVMRWLEQKPEFREQYARAKSYQADRLVDEIHEIADTPVAGVKTTTKADGSVETVEGDMIEHRRLQVDARKWMAGKLAPKKYGEKVTHAGDPDSPIILQTTPDNELMKRMAKLGLQYDEFGPVQP